MFLNDFDRIKKLGRYLTKDKKTIYLILLVLLPVSFAGAIQPLLVGQSISVLKGEPAFSWLNNLPLGPIKVLIICLLFSVLMSV